MAAILITGLPGHGKSLYAISLMMKLAKQGETRPVYACNFTELNHDVTQTINLEDAQEWHNLPQGSIVFVDEAQQFFRQRPANIPPPAHCRALETHRHRGHDIYFVTQDATTLDAHVRKFIDTHYHVSRPMGYGYSRIYEYQGYCRAPGKPHEPAISKRQWKHPKNLFQLYKSATMHTVKKRFPLKMFGALGVFAVIIYGAYSTYTWWNTLSSKDASPSTGVQAISDNETPLSSASVIDTMIPDGVKNNADKLGVQFTPQDYKVVHDPVVEHLPWSSPFYQQAIKPVDYPVPSCIINVSQSNCLCHSQQGTRMDVPQSICRHLVHNGFFDPTIPRDSNNAAVADSLSGGAARVSSPFQPIPTVERTRVRTSSSNTTLREEWNQPRYKSVLDMPLYRTTDREAR